LDILCRIIYCYFKMKYSGNNKLPSVKLYLEDIEHVIRLIHTVTLDVRIEADEKVFTSVVELSQAKKKAFHRLESGDLACRSVRIQIGLH
jgi:hypothetical protein